MRPDRNKSISFFYFRDNIQASTDKGRVLFHVDPIPNFLLN